VKNFNVSDILFLIFVAGIPLFATYKKINVFDAFIAGAKQGFETVINIVPHLVAMLVVIGMLRASGFFDNMSHFLAPLLDKIGMPAEILPLALIRPFSGSAANGILVDIIHHNGGNSYISYVAATIMGSTETTFYVVAVYFGAVNIRFTRHAIPAGLIADYTGVMASLVICHYLFGALL
jgi:spore maturation protein B